MIHEQVIIKCKSPVKEHKSHSTTDLFQAYAHKS